MLVVSSSRERSGGAIRADAILRCSSANLPSVTGAEFMHASALASMRQCIEEFMPDDRHYDVVDFGSFLKTGSSNHRDLLSGRDCAVLGVDIVSGHNVDVVMPRPYRIPLRSDSVDVVISGQVFEHIPFFFTSMLEIQRILRPGGRLFLTVPSRGHRHNVYDCWRFYPDGMRAMAAFAALELERATTDFPPMVDGRFDYSRGESYWGDTTGVFRKPERTPRLRLAIVRRVMKWWSNSLGDLERHPIPGSSNREGVG
jgi:SAM-dependent methyltransferase